MEIKKRINVLSIENPFDFWICEKNHEIVLEYMNKNIQKDNASSYELRKIKQEINELIGVRLADNNWYRAKIIGIYAENRHLSCFLLDTGKIVSTSISNCTAIHNLRLLKLEPFAKHCRLHGIEPYRRNTTDYFFKTKSYQKWPEIACNYFYEVCKNERNKLFIEFKSIVDENSNKIHSVVIYIAISTENLKSMNELLVDMKYALPTESIESFSFNVNNSQLNEIDYEIIGDELIHTGHKEESNIETLESLTKCESNKHELVEKNTLKLNTSDEYEKEGIFISGTKFVHKFKTIQESPIDDAIKNYMDVHCLKEIQRYESYLWPFIFAKNKHICAVTSDWNLCELNTNSGEYFMSYLIPLLSRITKEVTVNELNSEITKKSQRNGPIILILCTSCKNARRIFEKTSDLLEHTKSIEVRAMCIEGGCNNESEDLKLLNGVDILICATPFVFLRKLANGQINLERVQHIVLDDADYLLNEFPRQIQELMRHYTSLLDLKKPLQVAQFILYSKNWSNNIKKFLDKYFSHKILLFKSKLEASHYANVMHFVDYSETFEGKLRRLGDLLKVKQKRNTIAIIVNSNKCLEEIERYLRANAQRYDKLNSHCTDVEIQLIVKNWLLEEQKKILIINSQIVDYLSIDSLTCIINFDFPVNKPLERFGHYLWLMRKSFDENASKVVSFDKQVTDYLSCYTFISKQDLAHCNQYFDYLNRIKAAPCSLSNELMIALKKIDSTPDRSKIDKPLCKFIKSFGKCSLPKFTCEMRHFVDIVIDKRQILSSYSSDSITYIPFQGTVKFKVVYVKDTNNFFVHLISNQYNSEDGEQFIVEYNYFYEMDIKLQNYFALHKNKKFTEELDFGRFYAFKDKSRSVYNRIELVNVTEQVSKFAKKLHVCLIDFGDEIELSSAEIIHLPDEFQSLPGQAVEVYACNLKPSDKDLNWSVESKIAVSKKLITDKVFYGKIQLSAGKTLWLSPIASYKTLELNSTIIFDDCFKRDLLEQMYAIKNSEHLKLLRVLFDEAGYEIPQVPEINMQPYKTATPYFAYFDTDKKYNDVFVSFVKSPSVVFVQKCESCEQLSSLNDDIKVYLDVHKNEYEFMRKKESLMSTIREHRKTISGIYCVAKNPEDEKFNRAQVIEFEQTTDKFELYFVDYGDVFFMSDNDIYPISDSLIERLPFQAIECQLDGLLSLQDVCKNQFDVSERITNTIWNLTHDAENYHHLCKVVSKRAINKANDGNTRQYEVDFFIAERPLLVNLKYQLVARKLVGLSSKEEDDLFPFNKANEESSQLIDILTKKSYKNLIKDENIQFVQLLNTRAIYILKNSLEDIKNSGLVQTLSICLQFISQEKVLEALLVVLKRYFNSKNELFQVFCDSDGLKHLISKCGDLIDSYSCLNSIFNWLLAFHHEKYFVDTLNSHKDQHLMLWYLYENTNFDEIKSKALDLLKHLTDKNVLNFQIFAEDMKCIEKIVIRNNLSKFFLVYYESYLLQDKNDMNAFVCGLQLQPNSSQLDESFSFDSTNEELDNDEFLNDMCKCLLSAFEKNSKEPNLINTQEPIDMWSNKSYLYPKKIIWNQTNEIVTLKALFDDVKNLQININYTDSSIDFRANLGANEYGFEFQFYCDIVAYKSSAEKRDDHIEIKLVKKLNDEWPRLLKQMNKPKFLISEYANLNLDENLAGKLMIELPPLEYNEEDECSNSDESLIDDDMNDQEDIYWE